MARLDHACLGEGLRNGLSPDGSNTLAQRFELVSDALPICCSREVLFGCAIPNRLGYETHQCVPFGTSNRLQGAQRTGDCA